MFKKQVEGGEERRRRRRKSRLYDFHNLVSLLSYISQDHSLDTGLYKYVAFLIFFFLKYHYSVSLVSDL